MKRPVTILTTSAARRLHALTSFTDALRRAFDGKGQATREQFTLALQATAELLERIEDDRHDPGNAVDRLRDLAGCIAVGADHPALAYERGSGRKPDSSARWLARAHAALGIEHLVKAGSARPQALREARQFDLSHLMIGKSTDKAGASDAQDKALTSWRAALQAPENIPPKLRRATWKPRPNIAHDPSDKSPKAVAARAYQDGLSLIHYRDVTTTYSRDPKTGRGALKQRDRGWIDAGRFTSDQHKRIGLALLRAAAGERPSAKSR